MSPKGSKFVLFIFLSFIAGYLVSQCLSIFNAEEGIGQGAEKVCEEDEEISVEIAGAVANPGVYSLKKNSRIMDLIKMAGDFTSDYDYKWVSKNLNLSQVLKDEQKVFIPSEFLGYSELSKGAFVSIFSIPGDSGTSQSSSSLSSLPTPSNDSGKVNINEATFEELDALPGIGEVYAGKIIANRPYTGVEEFKQKSGLSNSVYEKIKDLIAF